jgi:hypothetical protein
VSHAYLGVSRAGSGSAARWDEGRQGHIAATSSVSVDGPDQVRDTGGMYVIEER